MIVYRDDDSVDTAGLTSTYIFCLIFTRLLQFFCQHLDNRIIRTFPLSSALLMCVLRAQSRDCIMILLLLLMVVLCICITISSTLR